MGMEQAMVCVCGWSRPEVEVGLGEGSGDGPAAAGGLGSGPLGGSRGDSGTSDPKEAEARYNKIMLVPVGVKNGIRRMRAGLQ